MTIDRESTSRHLRIAEIPATAWKNGGGVTREIASGGSAGGAQEAAWGWRVSLAEVAADGPFSIFPDIDRVIAVIEGAGMDLLLPEGVTLALDPFVPVRFAGEDAFDGYLRAGPVRDLNVMVSRGRYEAEMAFLHGPCTTEAASETGGALLLLNLQGRCQVQSAEAALGPLPAGEVLIHEGPGRFTIKVADSGRAALLSVRPR